MAITPVNTGAAPTPVASGNITASYPAGIQADDVLICHAVSHDNIALTFPAGWTIKAAHNQTTALRQTIAWKRRLSSDSDTSVLITHAAGDVLTARVIAFRGVDTGGDPFEATGGPTNFATGTSGTRAMPTVTTVTNDAKLLYFLGAADDQATAPAVANAQGLTVTEWDDGETTTGLDLTWAGYHADKATAGAQTGIGVSFTLTATAVSVGWAGALRPAAALPTEVTQIARAAQGTSATTFAADVKTAVPAGDAVVVVLGGNATGTEWSGVTDSKGNTYSVAVPLVSLNTVSGKMFVSVLTTALAPGDTITATSTGARTTALIAYAVTDIDASPIDQAASANSAASGTSWSSGATGTTAQNDEVLIGFTANGLSESAVYTAGSGWTRGDGAATSGTVRSLWTEVRRVSSTGAYTADGTTNGSTNWNAGIGTFKLATALDATVTPGAANADAAGSTPSVTVDADSAPGQADLTASGSTPTVDILQPDATVTPGAANATAAGSTPSVTIDAAAAPGQANATASGSTPTLTIDAAAAPGQANLTAVGSTAPIQGDSAASPGQAALTASGSTPAVTVDSVVAPGAANLTATGSTPVVTTEAVVDATVTPGQANLTATGSTATVLITPDPVIPPDQGGGGGRYEPGGDETSITGESKRIVAGTATLFASGSRATVLIEEPRAPVRLPRVRVRPRPAPRPLPLPPVVVNRVVVAGTAEARAEGSRAVVDGESVLSMDEMRRLRDDDEAAVAFLMLTS